MAAGWFTAARWAPEHAGVALEAAVTVAAASQRPHGTAPGPAGVPHTKASAITAEIVQ